MDSEDRDVKSKEAVRFCAGSQNTLGVLIVAESKRMEHSQTNYVFVQRYLLLVT